MALSGYKTVIYNGALIALPIIDLVVNNGAVINVLLGKYAALTLGVIGGIGLILRSVTTSAVFKPAEEPAPVEEAVGN